MIGFALFAAPYFNPPVLALARAVVVGGVLQLGYQLPHLRKIGMLVLPRLKLGDAGVWRVMRQMGPAILGVSVSQISLIINTIFASFPVSGSVSTDVLRRPPDGVSFRCAGRGLGHHPAAVAGQKLLERQPR